MDWYIINKFIGTYVYSIVLIISISIVFDVNENLAKFTSNNAPLRAIVFDYYANFVPYFANLFSPLFVFIAVIFFTSKLAGNSEIIAMLACGMSFKRLLRPYLISAALIALLNFYLGSYIIPKGTVVRHDFESLYKNNKKNTSASNIQLMVDKGVVAYISQYDDIRKTGYGFALYKFENKKMVSQMNANVIQYDTIAEERYHWKARNYKIRTLKGMREEITSGFTIIGVSLSSRKRKGGMGMYLGIGLALSFTYILLQTVSATFAINADTPPILAAWIPNILYAFIAYYCYRHAPN